MRTLALCLLLAPLAAQTTRVVDALGGAGTFPTLQAAVQAAAPGDVILVLPTGVYDFTLTTNKGVTILGTGPTPVSFHGTLVVSGLPANDRFAMRHFASAPAPQTGSLAVSHSQGLTVLEDLVLYGLPGPQNLGVGLAVTDSPQVAIRDSICAGSFMGSTVFAATLSANNILFLGITSPGSPSGFLGLASYGSDVHLTNCYVSGQAGIELSSASGFPSAVTLAGTTATSTSSGASVILFAGSALRVDSAATVASIHHGGQVGPGVPPGTVTNVQVGRVTNVVSSQTAAATFDGPAGAFGILVLALPGPKVASPLGTLWCDPQTFLTTTAGPVPLQTSITIPIGVPTSTVLVSQGALLHAGTLLLSGAVHAVVH